MHESINNPDQEPQVTGPEKLGVQFETITAASGEDVTVRTDQEALNAISAALTTIGGNYNVGGAEVTILGVAPEDSANVVSPEISESFHNDNVIWVQVDYPDGKSQVEFLRRPREGYSKYLGIA